MSPKYKKEEYLEKVQKRIQAKIKEDPDTKCWIWQGIRQSDGRYGRAYFGAKRYLAHRVSLAVHTGDLSILSDPKKVCCHKCDNPLCVNPKHLIMARQADNMKDMFLKGRHKSIEQIHTCPHCNKKIK